MRKQHDLEKKDIFMNVKDLVVLEYEIDQDKDYKKDKHFKIYLGDRIIGIKRSPVLDGARLLLELGYDPDQLMTTKSRSSQNISWKPQAIRKWAKLRAVESDDRVVCIKSFREWTR